jgi:hypothetical protein
MTLATLLAWDFGRKEFLIGGVIAAVYFLYTAIKYMIDESHVNYLMHQWDLRETIERIRRAEHRRH